jgi:hypothetical protein
MSPILRGILASVALAWAGVTTAQESTDVRFATDASFAVPAGTRQGHALVVDAFEYYVIPDAVIDGG